MNDKTQFPAVQIAESVESVWGSSFVVAGCLKCGQAFLVEESRLGQYCPHCAQGVLQPQPARLRPEPPELLIPFQKNRQEIHVILQKFVQPVWLRCPDFTVQNLLMRVTPVYWPMWLVDADLQGDWRAEVGYDYQVKSSQESYHNGGWRSQDVLETRIRWEPRLGYLERHYDNVASPALNEHSRLARSLGSYRQQEKIPYQAEQVAHTVLQIPDLQPENTWPLAQAQLELRSSADCQQAAQGQHIRSFQINPSYSSLNWTQQLHPMYVTCYQDDDGQSHLVWINGQTGLIAGTRLASQKVGWKWAGILAAIAVGLFLLSLGAFAATPLLPPLSLVGILFIIFAFGFAVASIIPAVWPWQWNRRQTEHKIVTHDHSS
jgi:hypothetical protein